VRTPDDALIGAVLLKLFADRQLAVGEEVIIYMLHHMERSFAAASCLVAALDAAGLAAQRRITVPLVRQVLGSQDEGN
jgi:chromosomal replication initiation ATPase DnaA